MSAASLKASCGSGACRAVKNGDALPQCETAFYARLFQAHAAAQVMLVVAAAKSILSQNSTLLGCNSVQLFVTHTARYKQHGHHEAYFHLEPAIHLFRK